MIDGIAGIISRNLDRIRSNPKFDFEIPVSKSTGEIKTEKRPVAEYRGIRLIDFGPFVKISLSIHKYFNNGYHNYNDFSASHLFDTINELSQLLQIETEDFLLTNLEIGVNIITDIAPKIILQSVIMHRGKKFSELLGKNKNYKECTHSQYYIKIYDKGLQYFRPEQIIRCELKFKKMEIVNRLGIKTLSDLFDRRKLDSLSMKMLGVFNEILIGNPHADTCNLAMRDRDLFYQGHNPDYWENLIPDSNRFQNKSSDIRYKNQYKIYERKLSRFKLLVRKTGGDSVRNRLLFKIESKLSELIRKVETGENDHLLYRVNSPLSCDTDKKRCLVTGLDISMQKAESKFICTAGLRYFKKNHPDVWEVLKNRLSSNWSTAEEGTQIREIHHSIRNEYFNKVHNARKMINRIYRHPALFDQTPFIRSNILAQARI